nr:cobyrinate a,c-diamide synthase [uncultured Bacteroides sp.]
MKSHILIGAASSGSGKTTFTLGLLKALRNRGYAVQPFKCGPDYIDTQYHTLAAGQPSVNLDTWLASEEHVKQLYSRYGAEPDVCVTEGVMGLFDGYDGMRGSSAEIAELLHIPVVLILNARSMAYSAAPILYGYKHFHPSIHITGVVFNQVTGESHYSYLQQACKDVGVESLGYLPKRSDIEIPSRHLGLTLEENFRFDAFTERIAALIEEFVDVDRLLQLSQNRIRPLGNAREAKNRENNQNNPSTIRIAVAKDEAFNFTYYENIRQLETLGKVTYFSPLRDTALPAETDFVYLPGGYPEFFLSTLSSNISMLQSIETYARAGGKLLAECGGMMYLCRTITGMDGIKHSMAGILEQDATMDGMKLHLGYRSLTYKDIPLRGHEFHYSHLTNALPSVATQYNAKGTETNTTLIRYENVIAGYTHLYWGEQNILDLWK